MTSFMTTFLGVDTGGTFTDFVCVDSRGVRVHKVLSTSAAPAEAILQGIRQLGIEPLVAQGQLMLIHGSTVATNAALENKGVRTAFVTNIGFADILSLGRQDRSDIYALQPAPAPTPVPSDHCFELPGRMDASGNEIQHLDQTAL